MSDCQSSSLEFVIKANESTKHFIVNEAIQKEILTDKSKSEVHN